LQANDVVRLLKPGTEFVVQIALSSNKDKVSPPPRSVICGLDDPRAVQPAIEREAGEEAVPARLQACEPDPSHTGEACLLWDDLNVTESVEHDDVLPSKINYDWI
jgi:hypothetical protein